MDGKADINHTSFGAESDFNEQDIEIRGETTLLSCRNAWDQQLNDGKEEEEKSFQ